MTPRELLPNVTDIKLVNGARRSITITAVFQDGHSEDVTDKVSFKETPTGIVSVENGQVIALARGCGVIEASLLGEAGKLIAAQIPASVTDRDPFQRNEFEDFNEANGLRIEDSVESGKNVLRCAKRRMGAI